MSNETKRDVFNDLVEELANAYIALDGEGIGEDLTNEDKQAYLKDYDAALPDDLPVIPKAVGEYIKEHKAAHDSLAFALTARFIPNEVFEWMFTVTGDPDTELSQIEYVKQQDIFARAWLLGVWRVEETGEIVKLEAQK
ncbi:hypothetical protein FAM22280_02133 [Lacticaseibacillus paracasei]|uniref:hypothetical protein n=1 Tax=Lacticaseibacillus paracasei TaxID=1597 RepID=UPI000FF15597|nr:hypothetical protein [Lacticaseibacillus paracasei]RNE08865.1 hypothetical protein FAM22280_02133 [Lacticaseibacillus paracasei]